MGSVLVVEHWTSSVVLLGSYRDHGSLPNRSTWYCDTEEGIGYWVCCHSVPIQSLGVALFLLCEALCAVFYSTKSAI